MLKQVCKHTFVNPDSVVTSCAWFPNSKQFVCGCSDPEKVICMWDCDGNEIKAWRGMRMPKALDIAVTPDGEYLISVFMDKEIQILHMGTNAEQVISEEHPITSLSVSGDSKFFIVNLNSQEIHMWDVAGKWDKPLRFMGHKQCKYVDSIAHLLPVTCTGIHLELAELQTNRGFMWALPDCELV